MSGKLTANTCEDLDDVIDNRMATMNKTVKYNG